MRTNYEEKTYESYFNSELDRFSNIYFPIGQVQEGFLGFDSSADSSDNRLWRRMGFPFLYPGIRLREITREIERYIEISVDELPPIRANLLFQYKKPAFMLSSKSREWDYWNEPYYRYSIYQRQQILLDRINSHFEDKVLILYASPAIRNINELVEIKIQGRIISSSNFTRAADLNGHFTNTYIKSGTYSQAFSKPKRIENVNILSELESIKVNENERNENNRRIIIEFARYVSSVMAEDINFQTAFELLDGEKYYFRRNELVESFVKMSIFKQLTGIQWLVKI